MAVSLLLVLGAALAIVFGLVLIIGSIVLIIYLIKKNSKKEVKKDNE